MMPRPPSPHPRAPLALAWLHRLLPDNEPLIGDIVEASADRSAAWLWSQLLYVVLVRIVVGARAVNHAATVGHALVSVAMLVVLGFEVFVTASLLNYIVQPDFAWITLAHRQEWLAYAVVLSVTTAAAIRGFRRRARPDHSNPCFRILT